MAENTMYGNGVNQEDLVALMVTIDTNWEDLLEKLDADTQLTGNDYESTLDVTWPEGIQNAEPYAIRHYGLIWDWALLLGTNFNSLLAKLDADALAGLDNDYESTLSLTSIVSGYASLGMQSNATYQGSMVYLFNAFITKFNLLLVKLDADPLDASDYAATLAISDTIDETGTESNPLSHGAY